MGIEVMLCCSVHWEKAAEVDWRHGVVRRSEQCPLSSCSGPNCMGPHGEGLCSNAKVSVREVDSWRRSQLGSEGGRELLRVRSGRWNGDKTSVFEELEGIL